MLKIEKYFLVAYLIFFNSFLFTSQVNAYIDPSAVTYTAQAIAAIVIAIGSSLTIFKHKIISLFKKNKDKKRKIIIYEDIMKD